MKLCFPIAYLTTLLFAVSVRGASEEEIGPQAGRSLRGSNPKSIDDKDTKTEVDEVLGFGPRATKKLRDDDFTTSAQISTIVLQESDQDNSELDSQEQRGRMLATAIDSKYTALGGANGFLGAPLSPERSTSDGVGTFRDYENGSIYWHPSTGAYEIHGWILWLWARNGWQRGLGYPTTDEMNMDRRAIGRFSRFQHGEVVWTPDMSVWADYHGGFENGGFSGGIHVFKHSDYEGSTRYFSLETHRPIVFQEDLRSVGLHDEASSIRLWNIPAHCSVYLFEHSDITGRYTRISGSNNYYYVGIKSLGKHMGDKLSTIVAVNHGLASVRINEAKLSLEAKDALEDFEIDGVRWDKDPEVHVEPRRRLRIYVKGTIPATWPDSYLKLSIYFRLYMTGDASLEVHYAGYYAKFGGSVFGVANKKIKQKLRNYFGDSGNVQKLTARVSNAFEAKMTLLKLIVDKGPRLHRVNFLPNELEFVLADTEEAATKVKEFVPEVSWHRPAAELTTGNV